MKRRPNPLDLPPEQSLEVGQGPSTRGGSLGAIWPGPSCRLQGVTLAVPTPALPGLARWSALSLCQLYQWASERAGSQRAQHRKANEPPGPQGLVQISAPEPPHPGISSTVGEEALLPCPPNLSTAPSGCSGTSLCHPRSSAELRRGEACTQCRERSPWEWWSTGHSAGPAGVWPAGFGVRAQVPCLA